MRSLFLCRATLVLLLSVTLAVAAANSSRRWFKRAYSDASQSFINDTLLQCQDYALVMKAFVRPYGSDAAITTFSWHPGPSTAACPDLNASFSPTIWGRGTLLPPLNATIMPSTATVKWNSVLGFWNPNMNLSEPTAKLTPYEAAELWPQIVALAQQHGDENTIIVSPAMNPCSGDSCYPDVETGEPVAWLNYTLSNCSAMNPGEPDKCRMDAIAVNHYGNCTASDLESFINSFSNFHKPIWVTEFACHWWPQQNDTDTIAYLKETLPMLENHPAVQRYFYFVGRAPGFNTTQLFQGTGNNVSLTAVGELYFGYPANFSEN